MNGFKCFILCALVVWSHCFKVAFHPDLNGYHYQQAIPQDVMVDIINYLGLSLLEAHNENNNNNIALSPYGAASVLVAIGEGLRGSAGYEIQHAVHLPDDISVIRVGLRDIHRHLKSYFIPKEGFLAGLTLNRENITLNPTYEEILRFYGYDLGSFNNDLYPETVTTTLISITRTTDLEVSRTTERQEERTNQETTSMETTSNLPETTELSTMESSLTESTPEITTKSERTTRSETTTYKTTANIDTTYTTPATTRKIAKTSETTKTTKRPTSKTTRKVTRRKTTPKVKTTRKTTMRITTESTVPSTTTLPPTTTSTIITSLLTTTILPSTTILTSMTTMPPTTTIIPATTTASPSTTITTTSFAPPSTTTSLPSTTTVKTITSPETTRITSTMQTTTTVPVTSTASVTTTPKITTPLVKTTKLITTKFPSTAEILTSEYLTEKMTAPTAELNISDLVEPIGETTTSEPTNNVESTNLYSTEASASKSKTPKITTLPSTSGEFTTESTSYSPATIKKAKITKRTTKIPYGDEIETYKETTVTAATLPPKSTRKEQKLQKPSKKPNVRPSTTVSEEDLDILTSTLTSTTTQPAVTTYKPPSRITKKDRITKRTTKPLDSDTYAEESTTPMYVTFVTNMKTSTELGEETSDFEENQTFDLPSNPYIKTSQTPKPTKTTLPPITTYMPSSRITPKRRRTTTPTVEQVTVQQTREEQTTEQTTMPSIYQITTEFSMDGQFSANSETTLPSVILTMKDNSEGSDDVSKLVVSNNVLEEHKVKSFKSDFNGNELEQAINASKLLKTIKDDQLESDSSSKLDAAIDFSSDKENEIYLNNFEQPDNKSVFLKGSTTPIPRFDDQFATSFKSYNSQENSSPKLEVTTTHYYEDKYSTDDKSFNRNDNSVSNVDDTISTFYDQNTPSIIDSSSSNSYGNREFPEFADTMNATPDQGSNLSTYQDNNGFPNIQDFNISIYPENDNLRFQNVTNANSFNAETTSTRFDNTSSFYSNLAKLNFENQNDENIEATRTQDSKSSFQTTIGSIDSNIYEKSNTNSRDQALATIANVDSTYKLTNLTESINQSGIKEITEFGVLTNTRETTINKTMLRENNYTKITPSFAVVNKISPIYPENNEGETTIQYFNTNEYNNGNSQSVYTSSTTPSEQMTYFESSREQDGENRNYDNTLTYSKNYESTPDITYSSFTSANYFKNERLNLAGVTKKYEPLSTVVTPVGGVVSLKSAHIDYNQFENSYVSTTSSYTNNNETSITVSSINYEMDPSQKKQLQETNFGPLNTLQGININLIPTSNSFENTISSAEETNTFTEYQKNSSTNIFESTPSVITTNHVQNIYSTQPTYYENYNLETIASQPVQPTNFENNHITSKRGRNYFNIDSEVFSQTSKHKLKTQQNDNFNSKHTKQKSSVNNLKLNNSSPTLHDESKMSTSNSLREGTQRHSDNSNFANRDSTTSDNVGVKLQVTTTEIPINTVPSYVTSATIVHGTGTTSNNEDYLSLTEGIRLLNNLEITNPTLSLQNESTDTYSSVSYKEDTTLSINSPLPTKESISHTEKTVPQSETPVTLKEDSAMQSNGSFPNVSTNSITTNALKELEYESKELSVQLEKHILFTQATGFKGEDVQSFTKSPTNFTKTEDETFSKSAAPTMVRPILKKDDMIDQGNANNDKIAKDNKSDKRNLSKDRTNMYLKEALNLTPYVQTTEFSKTNTPYLSFEITPLKPTTRGEYFSTNLNINTSNSTNGASLFEENRIPNLLTDIEESTPVKEVTIEPVTTELIIDVDEDTAVHHKLIENINNLPVAQSPTTLKNEDEAFSALPKISTSIITERDRVNAYIETSGASAISIQIENQYDSKPNIKVENLNLTRTAESNFRGALPIIVEESHRKLQDVQPATTDNFGLIDRNLTTQLLEEDNIKINNTFNKNTEVTEKTNKLPSDAFSNRKIRSIVDYVIARYYDEHYGPHYHQNYEPKKDFTFLVNGKVRETNVNYMTYDAVLPFYFSPSLNALALSFPLDSSKYYLLLLLPADDDGIDRLIHNLRSMGSLRRIISNLKYTHVKASIPSFMLKGYVVLTSTLQKLGIRKIFEPRQADFTTMTNDKDTYVTNIEQAVTVTIRNYVDPEVLRSNRYLHQYDTVEFKADHPFLYFVMDSDIHVTLMAGKIINPLNSRIR